MAIGLENYPNVDPPDSDYPSGRSKDNPGNNTGTPVKELTIGDYQQFFEKMMRLASIVPNQLPDNEYNGFQLIEALRTAAMRYKVYTALMLQSGSGAPTATIFDNTIGAIVWTRVSAGIYMGTLSNAFTSNKTFALCDNKIGINNGTVKIVLNSTSVMLLNTYDNAGTPTDGILTFGFIELRVYN
jgi:hypothetical protein